MPIGRALLARFTSMRPYHFALAVPTLIALSFGINSCSSVPTATDESQRGISDYALDLLSEGRKIFRSDTFGSEAFWGTTRLHDALAGEKNGGAGAGVRPHTALK